ncbi:MAG TPA: polyphosphate:AMP phosphotransferase [Spirochaetota bacterium]|nr:polyphosphate:AMP phosphotransferase [Spirochaetota bacterium]HOS32631.1 polyphosphate:AMP phosphotransferase [Spirochaetota bacterium]HOS56040.1 polyphosphate:AMP phosphotransferase [Spirochaetota bacterium]HPK61026.1 polyphosphate:AMP phosphotransferase [Spirochaetota bacterium]HQF78496.1 polyphosphate:AMP phosphotransferase [Spirochaetota bacterium]
MLEMVDLKSNLSKKEFKERKDNFKKELMTLQQKIHNVGIPVVIILEGWGASGKGSRARDIISYWDPRRYKTHSIGEPNTGELRFPRMARYWKKIPQKGEIAVFVRSWYQEVHTAILDTGETFKTSQAKWRERIRDIQNFERQLADNGYLIIKFFLHISRKEQDRRFKELLSNKNTKWRVTDLDQKHHERYEEYYEIFDSILEETHRMYAPWYAVSATDETYAINEMYQTIIEQMNKAIERKESDFKHDFSVFATKNFHLSPKLRLADVDLTQALEQEEYKERLEKTQAELSDLHNKLYRKKTPMIIIFEGWDAAGKGGAIRRLVSCLDPRGCEVIPIASPTIYEKNRHHLWRFWNALPKTGHIKIFDRSWYGRCMVERVEGFCSEDDWKRSYTEINEFEEYLRRQDFIIVKFWLHIDKDEQLRRFEERKASPEKQWKITDEDWRNREKWEQYEAAVEEMFANASTDFAPWTIIAGNDKYFARIQVIERVIQAIKDRL